MGRTRFVNAGCDTVNAYPEEVNGYLSAVNSCLVVAGPAIAVGESPQQVVMRSLQGGERTLRVGDLVPAGAAPSPGLAIPPPSSGDPAQAVAAHMTELR